MEEYISREEFEKARTTDLPSLLESLGETVKKVGSEYEWVCGGEKVSVRKNLWYNQYQQIGGDAIRFAIQFFGQTFVGAVRFLNGKETTPTSNVASKGKFVLPERNENMDRVILYLTKYRGIPREIVNEFVLKDLIYESAPHHNAVFVGRDLDGAPRHAAQRATGARSVFKVNAPNGTTEYCFNWRGTDDTLYYFESPIDMLSYIAMNQENWKKHSYAAACGVADRTLFRMLADNPAIKNIKICFDSDEAGQKGAERVDGRLFIRGIKAEILVPRLKDWNNVLLDMLENGGLKQCQE